MGGGQVAPFIHCVSLLSTKSACANLYRKHTNNSLCMLYSPVVFCRGTSDVLSKAMCSFPFFYCTSLHVLNKWFHCVVVEISSVIY